MAQNIIVPMEHENLSFFYTSGLEKSDTRPPLGEYLMYRDKLYLLTANWIPDMGNKK